jgi:hypothetical protein
VKRILGPHSHRWERRLYLATLILFVASSAVLHLLAAPFSRCCFWFCLELLVFCLPSAGFSRLLSPLYFLLVPFVPADVPDSVLLLSLTLRPVNTVQLSASPFLSGSSLVIIQLTLFGRLSFGLRGDWALFGCVEEEGLPLFFSSVTGKLSLVPVGLRGGRSRRLGLAFCGRFRWGCMEVALFSCVEEGCRSSSSRLLGG